MLLPQILELHDFLCLLFPVHDLLIDQLGGGSLPSLSDLLKTVQLDQVGAVESSLLLLLFAVSLLFLLRLLFLEFAKMRHLDQKLVQFIAGKPREDS